MRVFRSYMSASFQEDQMNAKRDVDDENDGETLGRTGSV